MKRIFFVIAAAIIATGLSAAKKPSQQLRVEPPYWWTDMQQDTLQLLVSGTGINNATVALDYPGVSLIETVHPDSPDYLLLYLNVTDNARPGTLDLRFTVGKKRFTQPYELKARDTSATGPTPFDAADVLYLIMPDRFADGAPSNNVSADRLRYTVEADRENPNGRHGGDIRGILDHLDYIDSLGVTAVWVNPVQTNDMQGGSYHGYATTDYYSIDPRFGSNDEWREFIKECHRRGLKVVMDMIFNHVG